MRHDLFAIYVTLFTVSILIILELIKINTEGDKMGLFGKKKNADQTWREAIIAQVQKIADTEKQKIDASIVSRVASLTIDETLKAIGDVLSKVKK